MKEVKVRTTISLPDPVLTKVKKYAQENQLTLTDAMTSLLQSALLNLKRPKKKMDLSKMPTFDMGANPNIDFTSNVAMLDFLDENE